MNAIAAINSAPTSTANSVPVARKNYVQQLSAINQQNQQVAQKKKDATADKQFSDKEAARQQEIRKTQITRTQTEAARVQSEQAQAQVQQVQQANQVSQTQQINQVQQAKQASQAKQEGVNHPSDEHQIDIYV